MWALLTVAAEARRRLVSIWLFSAGRLHTVEAPTNSIAATIRATNENPSQPAINTPAGIDLQLLAAPGTELFTGTAPGSDLRVPVPFLIVRRKGTSATFAALLTPFADAPKSQLSFDESPNGELHIHGTNFTDTVTLGDHLTYHRR